MQPTEEEPIARTVSFIARMFANRKTRLWSTDDNYFGWRYGS